MFKHPGRLTIAALALAPLALLGWLWHASVAEANIPFLDHRAPAEWILYPNPPDAHQHDAVELSTVFRRSFVLDGAPGEAKVSVRAMKRWELAINGQPVPAAGGGAARNWKEPVTFEVSRFLRAGTNEFTVVVYNTNGPPALWFALELDRKQMVSGADWEASFLGAAWSQARLADQPAPAGKGNVLMGGARPWPSLVQNLPGMLVFAAVSAGLLLLWSRWQRRAAEGFRTVTCALIGVAVLWVALFLNNWKWLSHFTGFDASGHLAYIGMLKSTWTLPLATDGWQMYQPPLYYVLCALLLSPHQAAGFDDFSFGMLRFLGLIIVLVHFTLIGLGLRLLFPGRTGTQLFGLALAAFLPANLYLAHYVSNESLAAMLVTGTLYLCLRILKADGSSRGLYLGLGACLGAALLTKFTAVIAVPFIGLTLLHQGIVKQRHGLRVLAGTLGMAMLAAAVVCGWHYLRVWRHFGNPLLGNWDARSGFHWWLEDGFHTRGYYFGFGQSLVYPWYSSFSSFADGLYSTLWGDGQCGGEAALAFGPSWNQELMAAGYLLALAPSGILLVGLAVVGGRFIRKPEPAWFLLLGVLFSTLAALVYMSLKLPYYGQVKAFYGLVALLPLCAIGAAGWEWAARTRIRMWIAGVACGVWAMNSYASFWIQASKPDVLAGIGRNFSVDGRHREAFQLFAEALRREPGNTLAGSLMAGELLRDGQLDAARQLAEHTSQAAPGDAAGHSILAAILATQSQFEPAVVEARRAIELAPDNPDAYEILTRALLALHRNDEALETARNGLRAVPFNQNLHFWAGRAFAALADPAKAAEHFRVATLLKPDLAEAQDQWGLSLGALQRWDEALAHFERAAQLRPGDAAAVYHLGLSHANLGRAAAAIQAYRRALELNPKFPPALNQLAWILATNPDLRLRDGREAVRLAGEACELAGGKSALFMGTLAAAQAEAGQFDEAVATAAKAIELARAAGQLELTGANEKALELYRAKHPCREPMTTPEK